jgi:hypothetical protein
VKPHIIDKMMHTRLKTCPIGDICYQKATDFSTSGKRVDL